MNLQDLSHWSDLLSAFAAIFICVTTYAANKTIKKISEYSNRQNDRKIIEDIYSMQSSAEREFAKLGSFREIYNMNVLVQAKERAKLYKLQHIQLHLEKLINLYGEGYVMHYSIWDEYGGYKQNDDPNIISKYYSLVKKFIEYSNDISCYQNHLAVN